MELFRNFRLKIGRSLLTRELKVRKRKRSFSGMDNVRTIGVVWDASHTVEFQALSKFYQRMNEQNIEVTIIGFFPGTVLPDQYTAIRYFTCLKNQDTDIFFRPVSSEAVSFINFRYDVLIDVNFSKLFPLTYISSLSVAGLKAGLTDDGPESSPFDLMIDLKNPAGIEDYLKEVIHYLGMIGSEMVKNAV